MRTVSAASVAANDQGIDGIDGLDQPRSGRPKTIDDAQIIAATLEPPPESSGVPH